MRYHPLLFIGAFCATLPTSAQDPVLNGATDTLDLVHVRRLSHDLRESSGLIWHHGQFWSHNDQGRSERLFRFSTDTALVEFHTDDPGLGWLDWEEISLDSSYLYMGDFGHTNGGRRELFTIHTMPVTVLDGLHRVKPTSRIAFTYPEPFDPTFKYIERRHHWDCEAMAAAGDSIYLFSKNWPNTDARYVPFDFHTFMYSLPKQHTKGTVVAARLDTLNVGALVSGAAYDPTSRRLALVGSEYKTYKPFLLLFNNFPASRLTDLAGAYWLGRGDFCAQVEAVAWGPDGELYITNENDRGKVHDAWDCASLEVARLWRVVLDKP